jgi:hypothetical protein
VTALVVPDDVADPTGFVLAACDLREARINAAGRGTWEAICAGPDGWEVRDVVPPTGRRRRRIIARVRMGPFELDRAAALHIAAEANPAHALAEVALWRGMAGRHWGKQTVAMPPHPDGPIYCCATCMTDVWPCPDLRDAVAAARAYLTGAGG